MNTALCATCGDDPYDYVRSGDNGSSANGVTHQIVCEGCGQKGEEMRGEFMAVSRWNLQQDAAMSAVKGEKG